MDNRQIDLSKYRIQEAKDSLQVAYFNKEYVAAGIFPKEVGRRLAILKQLREKSDYDDFYIASKAKAEEQLDTAKLILSSVEEYLNQQMLYNKNSKYQEV